MSEFHRDLLAEMYLDLTDEGRIAENKAKAERKKRQHATRLDAGLG